MPPGVVCHGSSLFLGQPGACSEPERAEELELERVKVVALGEHGEGNGGRGGDVCEREGRQLGDHGVVAQQGAVPEERTEAGEGAHPRKVIRARLRPARQAADAGDGRADHVGHGGEERKQEAEHAQVDERELELLLALEEFSERGARVALHLLRWHGLCGAPLQALEQRLPEAVGAQRLARLAERAREAGDGRGRVHLGAQVGRVHEEACKVPPSAATRFGLRCDGREEVGRALRVEHVGQDVGGLGRVEQAGEARGPAHFAEEPQRRLARLLRLLDQSAEAVAGAN
mmetsp:Transcript_6535/g.19087  ORF Transcript_6535/g.19087 Transcript_6535/m.19087 type:complete len:288 (+) Transcript_6535:634-1497(+)